MATNWYLMIKIPLIALDPSMTLYKIYNLLVIHHKIGISLLYKIEGNNLAVAKDNKYATIMSGTEFIQCTLVQVHFCSVNTALHHIDLNTMY